MLSKRMRKRGQVTIFIIIAVLLVGMGVAFFVFKDKINIGKPSVEISPIQTAIQSCLETTAEDGINYIALRGGYYKIPTQLSFSYLAEETAYYYINSEKTIPSNVRIGNELGNYIENYMSDCINFSSFEEQEFEINKGNLSISTVIGEGKINVKATYPLTITKGESTFKLSEFKVEINSNIERLCDASEEIVDSYKENPGFVCLNCLDDISNGYDIEAKATPLTDNNVIWFSIQDKESELNLKFVVEQ